MQVQTAVKAGAHAGVKYNHNEAQVRGDATPGEHPGNPSATGGRATRGMWQLTAGVLLTVLGAGSWVTRTCQAQITPDSDRQTASGGRWELMVYEGDTEVGRVYRDGAGPDYTEHWVLFPNFRFDRGLSKSMRIEAVPGRGYRDVDDFLARVPFPAGSRYVCTVCQEFDRLPTDD